MGLEEMVKYFIWIVFFAAALTGIYLMLRVLGVL